MSRTTSGSPQLVPDLEYPEYCVQSLVDEWWTVAADHDVKEGQLLWAHVPFIDWLPYELVPEERVSPTEHRRILFRIQQHRLSVSPSSTTLPVAALPQNPGENYSVYRAKLRPVLVLSTGGTDIESALTRGYGKWQKTRTLLVAPYFGADLSTKRGGWNPQLVKGIRHAKYSQLFWDKLPMSGARESILRFDQIQPIGRHHESYEFTPYRLSTEAMGVIEEWFEWFAFGQSDPDGFLPIAHELFVDAD